MKSLLYRTFNTSLVRRYMSRWGALGLMLIMPQFVHAKTADHGSELRSYQFLQQRYSVYRVTSPHRLHLALNDAHAQPLNSFKAWQKHLNPAQQLQFAMNGGMFHANFQPVGLYIENGQQKSPLNLDRTSAGNFFMQPNGVLAWNRNQAYILTTQAWQQQPLQVDYATQSGPMLVINGQINPQFLADSHSKKIRNGVGIKDGQLYFVISEGRVSFYQFAQFFRQGLGIPQALYLDGSISSVYDAKTKRNDHRFALGVMVGLVED